VIEPSAAAYLVLHRADAEALIEEHALADDPFWRPIERATVTLPPCTCGSIALYAEEPPRMGDHHAQACQRWEPRRAC
jgi:hypothetical protein